MKIEFDDVKDRDNRTRHGVSLSQAVKLDWDAAMVWIDDRYDYDELRMRGLAPEGTVLYFVAFVERGDCKRIISLRKATRREARLYVEEY